MRRIETFYASRRKRELDPWQRDLLETIHEWIIRLVQERREGTIRQESHDESLERDFFSTPPTAEHARMLIRTVLEKGFIRLARRTGKAYELGDLMPDKAAINNYLDKWYLETEGEFYERCGTLTYFCSIVSSFTERTLTWVLLGRPSLNLEGEMAKIRFCENWRGKSVTIDRVSYQVKYWTLFLVFYLLYSNSPEVPRDRRLQEMILHSLVTISELQLV